jgi:hypothetical protein
MDAAHHEVVKKHGTGYKELEFQLISSRENL